MLGTWEEAAGTKASGASAPLLPAGHLLRGPRTAEKAHLTQATLHTEDHCSVLPRAEEVLQGILI